MSNYILFDLEHGGYISAEEYYKEAEMLLKSQNATDWRKASDLYLRAADVCSDIELVNIYHGCSADTIYKYIVKLDKKCSAEEFEHALKVYAKIPCLNRLGNADLIRNKWREIYHRYIEICHVPKVSYIHTEYLYSRFVDVHYQYAYDETPECRVNRYAVIEAFETLEEALIQLSKDDKLFREETVGRDYSLSEPFELLRALFLMNEFSRHMIWSETFDFLFMDFIQKYYSFMKRSHINDYNSKRKISSLVFDFYRQYYDNNKMLFPIRKMLLEGLEKGYIVVIDDKDADFLFEYIFTNTKHEQRCLVAEYEELLTNDWE